MFKKAEEAVEEAVVTAGEGIAAGAALVATAVGVGIITWSSIPAPPWMDEFNQETGKPYASEDEWKAVKDRRSKPQRGGRRQPQPGPLIDPQDPDAEPQEPTCKNTYPTIWICAPPLRGYETLDEAAKAQPQYPQQTRYNMRGKEEYKDLPGGEDSHATYYDGADKLFTLIKRPCCQDTDAGPVLIWRWVSD